MSDARDLRIFEQQRIGIDSSIAFVRVGSKNRLFHVHEGLLAQSDFFRRKLAARKITKSLDVTIFEGEDGAAATFSLYVHRIYYGTLPCKVASKSVLPLLKHIDIEQTAIARLYIMAQKLGDSAAMDMAISTLLVVSQEACVDEKGNKCKFTLPSAEVVSMVYEHTSTTSPIRRLMVDMYHWWAAAEHIDEKLPPSFVVSLARAALDQQRITKSERYGSVVQASCCDYHQHDGKAACSNRRAKQEIHVAEDDLLQEIEEDTEEESSGGTYEDEDSN